MSTLLQSRDIFIKQCNALRMLLCNINRKQISSVVNKDRLLSYYSYCIPKSIHIQNKNFGKITPSFGYAGEDAFFNFKLKISESSSSILCLGVADGVGSWNLNKQMALQMNKQKDAAQYAQQLMLSGIDYLSSISLSDIQKCRNLSQQIAEFASNSVRSKALIGASTLTIVDIGKYNGNESSIKCQLSAYNLGDSGFCVYRYRDVGAGNECYECIYKSVAQEQGFGIPYQLGSHSTSNCIEDGCCLNVFDLCAMDIVIVGSDGLWDNCFDDEILALICQSMNKYLKEWKNEESAVSFDSFVHHKVVNGDITHRIIKQAYMNSIDKKKQTPWSRAMTETVDMVYDGGKTDDITCAFVFIH